ncbi:hypothetical protein BKA56DRAFT_673097 [Ilyonectria sp. MPI-CAGE-AT-0026]|nr:hypothetical protein BKA56DRAFT_673097 [Ilyonectria sp. MPI-CAGE-AT-0026]
MSSSSSARTLEHRSINRACEECKRSQDCFYPRRKPREEKRRRMTAPNVPSQGTNQPPSPNFSALLQPQQQSPDSTVSGCSQIGELDIQLHNGGATTNLGLANPLSAGWDALDAVANEGGMQSVYSSHDIFQFWTEALPEIWHNDDDVNQSAVLSSYPASSPYTGSMLPPLADSSRGRNAPESEDFGHALSPFGNGRAFGTLLQEEDKRYSLDIPAAVADDVLYLFFLRVQPFLPLFHRPQFYQTYIAVPRSAKYVDLTKQSTFLLYAMMALSARY